MAPQVPYAVMRRHPDAPANSHRLLSTPMGDTDRHRKDYQTTDLLVLSITGFSARVDDDASAAGPIEEGLA